MVATKNRLAVWVDAENMVYPRCELKLPTVVIAVGNAVQQATHDLRVPVAQAAFIHSTFGR
jgi:uncharacterized ferredoxin-like protein